MDHERYELFILFSSSSSSFILEPLFILKVYLLRRLAHRRFERKRRGMAIMFSSAASSSHPLFPNMFTPLDLGPNIEPLTNRVIMGSMHCGLEGHARPKPLVYLLRSFAAKQKHSSSMEPSHQEQFGAYLAERAASGVSLIVTGGMAPNSRVALTPFGSKLTTQDEASVDIF
mmetsp:Transcript_1390/g.2129  ORF Transcript_1390/g.2129 Transcript_1390/m.2129 type:complete len:172 (-) Transcript_1390:498-1013(-)